MAYIGNNNLPFDPTRTAAQPRDAERFSGNGSTTNFTLSRTPSNGAIDVTVYVENVAQEPITAYDVVGNSLNFTEAPPSGTYNIYVIYRNITGSQVIMPDGSVSYNKLANNLRVFTTDNLTPDGNNTVFTLSEPPADANTVFVTVDGMVQRAPVHYTTSGSTITFTSAPPVGSNVHVRHLGFRTSVAVTAIPVATYIPQPNIATPTITNATLGGNTIFALSNTLYSTAGVQGYSMITNNGYIGIGTGGTPARPLHIKGANTGTGSAEISLESGTSKNTNKKIWNICLDTTGANTATANTQLYFRQLSDDQVSEVSGSKALTLNAIGNAGKSYVSFPQHPFFHQYSGTTGSVITGNFRAWTSWTNSAALPTTAFPNFGSSFNTTTGVFTVPVSGLYLIGMGIHGDSGSGRKIGHILHSNGSYTEFLESSSPYCDHMGTTLYYLVEGDTLRWGDHNGLPCAAINAWGYLIQQA